MEYAKENIVVGLDVGTTKICAVVGKQDSDEYVEIIGIGQCRSHGLRKGFVIDIENTASAIRKAVEDAELTSGCSISSVVVGIADKFIRGQNTRGMVTLKGREVVAEDVRRVIDSAQATALRADRKKLHLIPQEFIVDSLAEIEQPLGISGERLEARVHLITAASASIDNIIKACGKALLEVSEIVFQPLASAEAVLMADEREMGVVLIDIGGGTTDIAIFSGGMLRHTAVIPVAGNHLTNDLAVGLRVTISEAERVKCLYGCCLEDMQAGNTPVEVFTTGGRDSRFVTSDDIRFILQARTDELIGIVAKELSCSGFKDDLVTGAVITGGSSLLPGLDVLAEQLLGMPVRLGRPLKVKGLADSVCLPQFSTGVGLVLTGLKAQSVKDVRPVSLLETAKRRLGRLWEQTGFLSGI